MWKVSKRLLYIGVGPDSQMDRLCSRTIRIWGTALLLLWRLRRVGRVKENDRQTNERK